VASDGWGGITSPIRPFPKRRDIKPDYLLMEHGATRRRQHRDAVSEAFENGVWPRMQPNRVMVAIRDNAS
jgi:hypothetical protein